jgi:hypothetical protein
VKIYEAICNTVFLAAMRAAFEDQVKGLHVAIEREEKELEQRKSERGTYHTINVFSK